MKWEHAWWGHRHPRNASEQPFVSWFRKIKVNDWNSFFCLYSNSLNPRIWIQFRFGSCFDHNNWKNERCVRWKCFNVLAMIHCKCTHSFILFTMNACCSLLGIFDFVYVAVNVINAPIEWIEQQGWKPISSFPIWQP